MLEEESGIPAVAARRVEDVLAAADVEGLWVDEPAGQALVPGDPAADRSQGAGEAVVVALDEPPVVEEGLVGIHGCALGELRIPT